jgi:hypothetical protein
MFDGSAASFAFIAGMINFRFARLVASAKGNAPLNPRRVPHRASSPAN